MFVDPTSGEYRMTIALDFDETFTRDPELWSGFVRMAAKRGHRPVLITSRSDVGEMGREVREALAREGLTWLDIIFAGRTMTKYDAAVKAGLSVDVWVDDMPNLIMPPPLMFGGA